jgi:predicted DNA-binding transcriptional regulator
MTALAYQTTVPAFPLGRPVDGRPRYGMTQEQAHVYNWLVKRRPHNGTFNINFREVAVTMATTHTNTYARVQALVERGWLTKDDGGYRLLHPVKVFRK